MSRRRCLKLECFQVCSAQLAHAQPDPQRHEHQKGGGLHLSCILSQEDALIYLRCKTQLRISSNFLWGRRLRLHLCCCHAWCSAQQLASRRIGTVYLLWRLGGSSIRQWLLFGCHCRRQAVL